MSGTGTLVTRAYRNFRGVDFRGEDVDLSRSPDSVNMWKDYRQLDSVRTRPSLELVMNTAETVYGIFFLDDRMFIHYGAEMWDRHEDGSAYRVIGAYDNLLKEAPGVASFIWADEYGDNLFFLTGENYLKYDGNAFDVEGYIPTTTIGRKPSGGGVTHESVNLLTPERKNSFLADGESTEYFLDTQQIDEPERSYTVFVMINGERADHDKFTVDYAAGKVTFAEPPPAPDTDGQDNVVIQFSKTVPGYRERITKCTLCVPFDNRVFFSGNPDYPNTVWHSALNDPAYVRDIDYYQEGVDSAHIRGMVAGNNTLWVFREDCDGGNTVYYHTPTIDADYGKIYPSAHSSAAIGCIGKAINFNDDIVFFSRRGMEGISGDITTEQAVSHRSSLVDRKLLAEARYQDMILAEWNGYLLVFVGKNCYLADSRAKLRNGNDVEYEWFYWELEQTVTCAKTHDGVLYLGTDDGVYTLTGDADLESYWVTSKDNFGYPNMRKTTNKKGCVVEATGDVVVEVRTNGTDFAPIGSFNAVTDAFVPRIKCKKFKDIQLKFHSSTRFSLEAGTLECYIGGYIKR